MSSESSTFEMETKNSFEKILAAIGEMRQSFENRLDKIENRLDNVENRLDNVENRLDKIENRLDNVENRLDKIENEFSEYNLYSETQFEAIRQGLVKNYNQTDRLISEISQNRSIIYSVKADLGELSERVYLLNKSNENALKS